MNKKKVCVLTSSRADYGLLVNILLEIEKSSMLDLNLIVSGSHLSKRHGYSVSEIRNDQFIIEKKIKILSKKDEPIDIVKTFSKGSFKIAKSLQEIKPDIILLLGDRYETLAAAIAANLMQVPIGHIHGGELSEGALDDSFRHAITKMSHFHFVSTEKARDRVLQLGEKLDNVYITGGLGAESIKGFKPIAKIALEEKLNFKFLAKNLLITFHPATLSPDIGIEGVKSLLEALDSFKDIGLIFTLPNADQGNRKITKMIKEFVYGHSNAILRISLGKENYLSCMSYVDGVVGNSSSGILEAPSFGVGTINIGDRQKGREFADSIIQCSENIEDIRDAIYLLFKKSFKDKVRNVKNPYYVPKTAERIVRIIENADLENTVRKSFQDLVTYG